MEPLARIEARLHSLSELGALLGALRSMAASRLQEATQAVEGARAFAATIADAISAAAPLAPRSADAPGDGGAALLVIGSELGFVGGFNARLIRRAQDVVGPRERVVLIGRRGQTTATEQGLEFVEGLPMITHPAAASAAALRIAERLEEAGEVRLLHTRHERSAMPAAVLRTILPVSVEGRGGGTASPPLHHLPPEKLLRLLAREYLFAEIAAALVESLAAESVVRMRTLDAASRNISDRLERLTREAHMARQEETTAEMLDVV
ncbi:MAG: hypothetical protein D6773_15685, partial [Alphaproteobacteria bacterium]